MALVSSVLCVLLMLAVSCEGNPHPENNQRNGNKLTAQDLLNIIANSDDAGEEIRSVLNANQIYTGSGNKVKTTQQSTPVSQVTISTTTPSIGLLDVNQNIRPANSGHSLVQGLNHNSASGQGYQHVPLTSDLRGLLNYGAVGSVGAAQVSAIQHGQIVHDTYRAEAQAIQGARATEAVARVGQANAIHNAQALDATRTGNMQRAHAASLEYARAAEAARLAAAATAAQVARAQEAGRIANAAHFQAERIANAARTNLAIAASRAAGPGQLSSIVNSATLAIQAARETEAAARAGQVYAMRNAQTLDAVRAGNVHRAQAAVWENTRAAESARQAAAGTVAEMERAAEAERVAYAARVRANAIANVAAAQATFVRNTQDSMLYQGGYGYGY